MTYWLRRDPSVCRNGRWGNVYLLKRLYVRSALNFNVIDPGKAIIRSEASRKILQFIGPQYPTLSLSYKVLTAKRYLPPCECENLCVACFFQDTRCSHLTAKNSLNAIFKDNSLNCATRVSLGCPAMESFVHLVPLRILNISWGKLALVFLRSLKGS